MTVRSGLDLLERKWPERLRGAATGFLVHPASVNGKLVHAVDVALDSGKFTLKALFGPQHGIRGQTQDNMVEWEGFRDTRTGLPVYSLYGETRKPGTQMLKDIDVLIVDLQDIGSRYYTFIWTLDLCMQACRERKKALVVLDRPNPLNGRSVEGPVLDSLFASFVGLKSLPVRHGMTIGEIAGYFRTEYYSDLDFHVIRMNGWKRSLWFDETGLPWVMPSPNMPTPDTAIVYPGMCLLEGTNVSEGRGTTRPFELFGAPFIDPNALVAELDRLTLPGVTFRPVYFEPTFQKWAGDLCGGAQIHVTNRKAFMPFKTGVAVIKAVHDLYPKDFRWKAPPYEYEREKMPIDILAGTDRLRLDLEQGSDLVDMEAWWSKENRDFRRKRKKHLLYE